MALTQMLAGIYDTLFAPPGALEPEVSAFDLSSPAAEPTALTETHFATDQDVEWHNGFGTMNDFEVPASGFTSFDSFDSSQGDMFGSSDWT